MPIHTPAPDSIIAITAEDDRFKDARRRAIELARHGTRTLVLYDWDAPSLFGEPLPTWWSSDGWDSRFPDRLDPEELDGVGRSEIARQVREARAAGVDAFGWLPSDHGPGALADYATRQGAWTVVVPHDLEELAGLDALVNGTTAPADDVAERATARVVVV